VSNVEGGYVSPSQAFIDAYVALGADRSLVEYLLDKIARESRAAQARRRRADSVQLGPARAPQAVDDSTRAGDIRRHYTVEAYDVEFEFTGFGAIERVVSQVALRAVSNDVRFYFTGHALDDSNNPPPPPRVTALTGGLVERINVSPVGAFDIYFRLDRPIQPHDVAPHAVVYVVEFDDVRRADPVIVYFAPPGARSHTLITQFVAPALPATVWWFAVPESYLIDRPEPGMRLESSPAGRYEHTFTNLLPGWSYGFTWTW
jgi:hypothetical protein